MEGQNFKNHARYVPSFHFLLLRMITAVFVLSIINLFSGFTLSSIMFLLLAISSVIFFLKVRAFPLGVQDRAIRAKENLRYFSITGKLPDKDLVMGQIIALRFAGDEEFVDLAEKALSGNMSNKQIRQAIQKWKADHHRA